MVSPIFIAEIGMNYNKNFALASEMIRRAAEAGADIAKFQLGWRDQPGELNVINEDDIKHLLRIANLYNIELMFSVISENALDLFKKFSFSRVKIASRTVLEEDLFNKIRSLELDTIISFGMHDLQKSAIQKRTNESFLFCVSKYPTYYWDLSGMPSDFADSVYDGYSDHCLGIEACLIALSRGARIIEKHFTLDKSETNIRDHSLSATPREFETLVKTGTELSRIYQSLKAES